MRQIVALLDISYKKSHLISMIFIGMIIALYMNKEYLIDLWKRKD